MHSGCAAEEDKEGKNGNPAFVSIYIYIYMTRFAKTQHNDAVLELQIFASVSFMYLKLCSVAISTLYR